MKLDKAMMYNKLVRSRAEAQRLIKHGAVSIGGCAKYCSFFITGKCICGGWEKITNPIHEVQAGWCVKVGNGLWRTVTRIGKTGFDQLNGIGKVPYGETEETAIQSN